MGRNLVLEPIWSDAEVEQADLTLTCKQEQIYSKTSIRIAYRIAGDVDPHLRRIVWTGMTVVS